CVGINTSWSRNIKRRWQVGNHSIQHCLDALIFQRRARKYRHKCTGYRCSTKRCNQLLLANLLTLEKFEGQLFISFGNPLDQELTVLLKLVLHARRHLRVIRLCAKVISKDNSLLFNQIYETFKIAFLPNRNLNWDR